MVQLASLPNEIPVLIYSFTPTIQAAVQLSCVSHKLHDVWVAASDRIIAAILEPSIPAYKNAAALAVNEARLSLLTSSDAAQEKVRLYPSLWVPRLLRNAKLANSACVAMNLFLQNLEQDNYRRKLAFTSFPVSYYTIRQLVLDYHHPQLQSALREELNTTPLAMLRTHDEFRFFMCELMNEEERVHQGIQKEKRDWTVEDELHANLNKDGWEFAQDMLSRVLWQRVHSGS